MEKSVLRKRLRWVAEAIFAILFIIGLLPMLGIFVGIDWLGRGGDRYQDFLVAYNTFVIPASEIEWFLIAVVGPAVLCMILLVQDIRRMNREHAEEEREWNRDHPCW